jgi:predicted amidohydrolase YtcJ
MTDLLLVNANVMTMDPLYPRADAVAIKGGRIFAVGPESSLRDLRNNRTIVIDLDGKTILPGFIDAHLHLRALAESHVTLNIGPASGVSSIADIKDRIYQQALKLQPGTWIRAGGYNELYLTDQRDPNRWDLDMAAPNHPVKLIHRSGHAHVLNSLGLTYAGISKETPDPDEGLMERDLETGVFRGLGDLLTKVIPPLEDSQLDMGVKLASQELVSYGITTIQDASSRNDMKRWQSFEQWKRDGSLRCRIIMVLGVKGFEEYKADRFSSNMDENHLRLGGVKIVLDETTGKLYPSPEVLNGLVLSIHKTGLQVAIHAIEETTVEAACNALEHAQKISPRSNHRHRIEHCSVCPPDLARRIASLGGMVVTNPAFVYFSGERYLKTVPSHQLKYLYPIRTLMKNGILVAAGSDAPVAPVDPLAGVYGAVTRKAQSGVVVLAEEAIAPHEALRLYTEFAARSSFEEDLKGIIAPERLADLVVLGDDPTAVPIEEIKEIPVEMTILDGEVVYAAD